MESKIISITIKIGEDEFVLPFEEAKQLYEELKSLFEPKPTVSVSSVWEIKPPHYYGYNMTYSDKYGTPGTAPIGNIIKEGLS